MCGVTLQYKGNCHIWKVRDDVTRCIKLVEVLEEQWLKHTENRKCNIICCPIMPGYNIVTHIYFSDRTKLVGLRKFAQA